MNGKMHGWMVVCVNGWIGRWMGGCMGEWIAERMTKG